jgi:hypothetical protein
MRAIRQAHRGPPGPALPHRHAIQPGDHQVENRRAAQREQRAQRELDLFPPGLRLRAFRQDPALRQVAQHPPVLRDAAHQGIRRQRIRFRTGIDARHFRLRRIISDPRRQPPGTHDARRHRHADHRALHHGKRPAPDAVAWPAAVQRRQRGKGGHRAGPREEDCAGPRDEGVRVGAGRGSLWVIVTRSRRSTVASASLSFTYVVNLNEADIS